jgi:hypothetical protein
MLLLVILILELRSSRISITSRPRHRPTSIIAKQSVRLPLLVVDQYRMLLKFHLGFQLLLVLLLLLLYRCCFLYELISFEGIGNLISLNS